MISPIHPREALFGGQEALPVIASCEHFAGSRKLIEKGFQLQSEFGPIFDLTCDLEDGAAAGEETRHAQMVGDLIASPDNLSRMAGARIHDPTHEHCHKDIDLILERAGDRVAYLTIPKGTSANEIGRVIEYICLRCDALGLRRAIPVHVLIETHGALREVWRIAELPGVQVLDFGLMDFVSCHDGALSADAMRSPGQFEHKLVIRAKAEIVAAASANGIVAAHNVCVDLKDEDRVFDDARRARDEYGFLRMWSIHPAQIRPIVRAMQPSYSEIAAAAEILVAAAHVDWGPIQHQATLHDRASYRYFWNLLHRAKLSGIEIPEAARSAFFATDGSELRHVEAERVA
jgi:citrate lyase subunit beta/citryl-CoA lyase